VGAAGIEPATWTV